MYTARLVFVLLVILAVVAAYSPQAREQAVKTWEKVEPAVVGITDSLYVAIRNIVSGNTSGDGAPVPEPGVRFQRIVTMNISIEF